MSQTPPSTTPTAPSETATGSITAIAPDSVTGTGVVPGIAYAPVVWKQGRPETLPHEPDVAEEGREAEAARLEGAVDAVATRLDERASLATGVASEVLAATATLARDRGWRKAALKLVKGGTPAPQAVIAAMAQFISTFEKLGGLMAERTTDLRDIRDRVVAQLLGLPEPGVPTPAQPSVLFADDLAPADTAGLDPSIITALVTQLGGPTSHTAIIARQLGIPCIVAASKITSIPEGSPVLVDGTAGTVTLGVDAAEGGRLVEEDERRREAVRSWRGPAATRDGRTVELLANVQDGAGARKAAQSEARGVGLFRTELCFLNSDKEPSVPEQTAIYGEVFAAFAGQKVVLRTLDAGSDKPLKFANMEHEENPALGVRGVRIGLRDLGMLTRQLDAVAAAGQAREQDADTQPWVMAPMIATIPEAARFAQLCRERGITPGVMVEVPSVALLALGLPRARRVPLDRHERPVAVHDGRRPHVAPPGDTHRPVAAGRAHAHRHDGARRPRRRQARRRVRRGRRRPAARLRAHRARRHLAVDGRLRGLGRRRPARLGLLRAVRARRAGRARRDRLGGRPRRGPHGPAGLSPPLSPTRASPAPRRSRTSGGAPACPEISCDVTGRPVRSMRPHINS